MVDSIFFDNYGPFSLEEISKISGANIYCPDPLGKNPASILIDGLAPLDLADSNHISILHNSKYFKTFSKSKVGACFVDARYVKYAPQQMVILVSDNLYKL